MYEYEMPSLGADMESGKLVEWLVAPGASVKRGDIVAVVETDKGAIEIEIFVNGVLREQLVEPGRKVPVGTPLALVEVPEGEPLPARPSSPPLAAPAEKPASVAAPAPKPTSTVAPAAPAGGRLRASPLARRRAAELGVDLTQLAGTFPHGAIAVEDVETAAAAPREEPAAAASPAEVMRQAIGAAMARSKREIPHYYLAASIDLTAALTWLEAENTRRPVPGRLLYAVLLLKAVALALKEVPELNGFWRDGRLQPSSAIHVGAAIALRGGGLIAPALHDTDRQDLGALMAAFRDLVKRARGSRLRGSEFSDPTITVTSLGERGVETLYPVIYPPQVAIVGFGTVVERPWVVDGSVVPRRIIQATLAADHRASDGHRGALFLRAVNRLLQTPEAL